jgi:hypothetical protein
VKNWGVSTSGEPAFTDDTIAVAYCLSRAMKSGVDLLDPERLRSVSDEDLRLIYRDEKNSEPRYFLAELNPRVNGALYPRAKKWIFPYNTGRLSGAGHFSAVFLGSSREEVEEMAHEFESRLAEE